MSADQIILGIVNSPVTYLVLLTVVIAAFFWSKK